MIASSCLAKKASTTKEESKSTVESSKAKLDLDGLNKRRAIKLDLAGRTGPLLLWPAESNHLGPFIMAPGRERGRTLPVRLASIVFALDQLSDRFVRLCVVKLEALEALKAPERAQFGSMWTQCELAEAPN